MEGVREKGVDAKEIKDEDENKKKQKTKKKKRRSPSLARFGCLRVESDKNGGVDMEVEFPGERNNPTHLVIMVNGIIGSALDWRYAAKQFLKKYPQDVVVHCSERNSSLLTLDGVDVMGDRLAEEVKEVKRRHPSVQKISFIGHSLGGLISRYAIARLYEEDVKGELSHINRHCGTDQLEDAKDELSHCGTDQLEDVKGELSHCGTDQLEDVKGELSHCGTDQLEDIKGELSHCGTDQLEDVKGDLSQTNGHCGTDQLGDTCLDLKSRGRIAGLEPMNFITVATPHLGSRWHKQVPLFRGSRALEKVAAHTSWLLGRTGKHLFLTDGTKGKPPLLLRMTNDCEDLKFMSALQSFRRRVVYANASYDHIVGWSTSSLRRRNELPKLRLWPQSPAAFFLYIARCCNGGVRLTLIPKSVRE
ncbi:hypothetical protein CCACVL1_30174 [Corchorus capsularis]|uniref:DUF676 domain-containing protein n=1 Tax=Corchorus capsularis TaxID=210143 RepID=A0A1R3FYM3_COCAP|nr:hypothetical protein CCACVL1_30174 [Corchorus capsularis]